MNAGCRLDSGYLMGRQWLGQKSHIRPCLLDPGSGLVALYSVYSVGLYSVYSVGQNSVYSVGLYSVYSVGLYSVGHFTTLYSFQ